MLLPPLCMLGLSLVSPGNFTDLGCRLRLCRKHLRNHLEIVEQSNLDWGLISGSFVMTSSIMVSEMKRMRNG
ncbi:hypothetical protein F2Q68_00039988 [Brassica cretica]|uniref:Uncharacterized protein n=1 Tax=Brassica cretica TaxID=69181 RepID=A0A8S9MM11_BRACR|nr:hypothetical protein F2Q68_00039988 [Brassica cretica]